jgi:hypothetical protein
VFEGYDCRGRDLVINADNVTVRNCLSTPIGYHALNNSTAKRGFVAEFCFSTARNAEHRQPRPVLLGSRRHDLSQQHHSGHANRCVIMCGGRPDASITPSGGSYYQTGAHADAFTIGKSSANGLSRKLHAISRDSRTQSATPNSCVKVVAHFGHRRCAAIEGNILIGGGYNMPIAGRSEGTRSTTSGSLTTCMGLTEGRPTRKDSSSYGAPNNGSTSSTGNKQLFQRTRPDDVVSVVGSGSQPPGRARLDQARQHRAADHRAGAGRRHLYDRLRHLVERATRRGIGNGSGRSTALRPAPKSSARPP